MSDSLPAATLYARVSALRQTRKGFFTNAYFSAPQLDEILNRENVRVLESEHAVIILADEGAFVRCFIYLDSFDGFPELTKLLGSCGKPVISEVVGQGEAMNSVSAIFATNGWVVHNRLSKMYRMSSEETLFPSTPVEPATLGDAEAIHSLLYEVFDPMTSHLPRLGELRSSIENSEVQVVRAGGGIAALSIFQRLGKRSKYLYQIAVAPVSRRRGCASALLNEEFSKASASDQYSLWVEATNLPAKQLYHRYGFRCTGQELVILRQSGGN